jgi:hypothetical protein
MLAPAETCAGDEAAGADPNAMALTPEPAPLFEPTKRQIVALDALSAASATTGHLFSQASPVPVAVESAVVAHRDPVDPVAAPERRHRLGASPNPVSGEQPPKIVYLANSFGFTAILGAWSMASLATDPKGLASRPGSGKPGQV